MAQPQQNNPADLKRPPLPQTQGQSAKPRALKVTYRPGPEDRAVTIWNGIRFEAGRPVLLSYDNRKHFIEVDMPKQIETEDGSYHTRTVATRISMIDRAKENYHFEVEGFPRAIKPIPAGRKPQSAEEYRSWAQAWFAEAGGEDSEVQTTAEMKERWDDEEALRDRLGVGEDDVAFLKPFFDMRVAALKKDMAVKYAAGDGGAAMQGFTDD